MSLNFIPIASGSSGNCTFVGTSNTKILIDVGVSCKKLEQAIQGSNINLKNIDAIFVTHEHSDHIDGVGVVSRKYDLPIYATKGTWDLMQNKIGEISKKNINIIYPEEKIFLNDLYLYPFSVSHDAKEPICYNIYYKNYKASILTDLGYIDKQTLDNIKHCDILYLESNHDEEMVKASNYPYTLKQRILSKKGHISNETAGKLLACVINPKLKNVFLAHLSEENNTPELAYLTVASILDEFSIKTGIHINLHVASKLGVKQIITLG